MTRTTLYAEFTALTSAVEQVEQLILELATSVRQEVGNLAFEVYRTAREPRKFFVFEQYASDDAFAEHMAAPYSAPFNDRLGPLIEEDGSQLTFLSEVR